MKLLELIRKESSVSLGWLFFIAAVSAICNALLLIIVNAALEDTALGKPTFRWLFLFVVLLAIFALTRKHLLIEVSKEFEQILHKVRTRIADKIRRADLLSLEKLERAGIYASVQRETLEISSIGKPLVTVVQALLLLVLTLIYIFYMSPFAFLFAASIIVAASIFYLTKKRALGSALRDVLRREDKVFETLSHVLDGIKEVQLNTARSEDLMNHARSRSQAARDQRISVDSEFIALSIVSQIAIYGGLALLVFVLPQHFAGLREGLMQITIAYIFLINPVFGTLGMIPDLYHAEVAVQSIHDIESRLDQAVRPVPLKFAELSSFQEIVLDHVAFQFEDPKSDHPFAVGPINLTINPGEVLFLAGGNGSGKSTLLRLITALYHPQSGAIYLDGTRIETPSQVGSYQSLFTTVFSDFHLFDRLYGLPGLDPELVDRLLRELGLTGKTDILDGAFATLNLSTGQRKRLALLVALLEDRPIFILDEWAAEQDAEFRKKFYREILPQLKAAGKAVIAVTHDDRYFSVADKVFRMEEGRLTPLPVEGTDDPFEM
ncbi:MAG TPA: cyclic peptide export ABC transporter [Thermoanaerobaculia bacterium]|nr:cyclic peptide export ABC transporter [Thermoanaerobaculia bacterium]